MPDLILTNARIHTLDAVHPTARAIALRGNVILAYWVASMVWMRALVRMRSGMGGPFCIRVLR